MHRFAGRHTSKSFYSLARGLAENNTGGFVCSAKKTADHNRITSKQQSQTYMTIPSDTPVGNDRNFRNPGAFIYRLRLRNADVRIVTSRTGRTRAQSYFDAVDHKTLVDLHCLGKNDIAHDQLRIGELSPEFPDCLFSKI